MARKTDQQNAPRPESSGSTGKRAESAARVGTHLRSIYSEVLAERVPDNLQDLLNKLG